MGPSLAGKVLDTGASANKAFSIPIRFLPEGGNVWSWFPGPATTSTALGHMEQEAAQTLFGPGASRGLGEKPASAAVLSKHALGLSLVS